MSIFGPCSPSGAEERAESEIDLSSYARKTDVVARSGGRMGGPLDMEGHSLRGLPVHYPPLIDNEAVSWLQAQRLVESQPRVKPVISIWAEERGALTAGSCKWSFGDNSRGSGHRHGGYTMMTPGRVIRMGLSCVTSNGLPADSARVSLVKDGVEQPGHHVQKTDEFKSAVQVFHPPLEVQVGTRLNFLTRSSTANANASVVSLLIELDLD